MFGLHEVNKAWGNTFDEEEVLEEHSEVQHWDFLHSPSHQGHDADYGNGRGKFQASSFTYHLLNRSRLENQCRYFSEKYIFVTKRACGELPADKHLLHHLQLDLNATDRCAQGVLRAITQSHQYPCSQLLLSMMENK